MARELGPGEFGLWLNLTTAYTTLAVFDLGVGPAVMGQVSAARGHGDGLHMRRVVSTAFVFLAVTALALILVSGALTRFIDWSGVLGVQHEVPGELVRQLVFAVTATAALSLPFAIAGRVYQAIQRSHVTALSTTLGVVLQAGTLFG
ncbi:hypothetical protein ACFQ0G_25310 [Streptomyces chiangmaiensis]